jgi:hypothetical protein
MSSKFWEVIMIINMCVGREVWGKTVVKVQVVWFYP